MGTVMGKELGCCVPPVFLRVGNDIKTWPSGAVFTTVEWESLRKVILQAVTSRRWSCLLGFSREVSDNLQVCNCISAAQATFPLIQYLFGFTRLP